MLRRGEDGDTDKEDSEREIESIEEGKGVYGFLFSFSISNQSKKILSVVHYIGKIIGRYSRNCFMTQY